MKEAAPRLRHRPAQLFGRFDPFLDDDLGVCQGLLIGRPLGRATGQLWNLGNECLVGLAQIEDDLVPTLVLRLAWTAAISFHRRGPCSAEVAHFGPRLEPTGRATCLPQWLFAC